MKVNIYGYEYLSSIEVPGKLSMIVFFGGCNLDCEYCQNYDAIGYSNYVNVEEVKERIFLNRPLIDNVVFSGGESTLQFRQLVELCKYCKIMGLETTVETNGTHPGVIHHLSQHCMLDRVHVDFKKRCQRDYYQTLIASEGLEREVHFTVFPNKDTAQDLCELAFITPYGIPIVLQRGRSTDRYLTEEFSVDGLYDFAMRLPRQDVYISSEQGRMRVK